MTNKRFAVVNDDRVENILLWSGLTQSKPDEFPEGESWLPFPENINGELIEINEDVHIGDIYAEGIFSRVSQPNAPTVSRFDALADRAARLAQATREIDPLQDLVDLNMADDQDRNKLLEWKQYRAAVGKVSSQISFPELVEWPPVPEI